MKNDMPVIIGIIVVAILATPLHGGGGVPVALARLLASGFGLCVDCLHHQGNGDRVPNFASPEQRAATWPATKNVSPLLHR